MSLYTIVDNDAEDHRRHLAGPILLLALEELDNELRSFVKHGTWPDGCESGATLEFAKWIRRRIGEAIAEGGVKGNQRKRGKG